MPRRIAGFGAALLCVALTSGCTMSSMGGGEEVDRSLVTANVPPTATSTDTTQRSDEMTIRNAVSSADLVEAGPSPLAWANTDTGSRGAISAVPESKESGTVCRKFTTTRESFDGVAMFNGKACMVAPGAWQLTTFAPS